MLVNTLSGPLLDTAVDAILITHGFEHILRTVASRRNLIRQGLFRAVESRVGSRRTVRTRPLFVVRVITAPFEQVEAHPKYFVRRTYGPGNLALELHDPIEFECHVANQLSQRHRDTGDRQRNRAATLIFDRRPIRTADAEPLGSNAVECSFDLYDLFAESLVIDDVEHRSGFRIGFERP